MANLISEWCSRSNKEREKCDVKMHLLSHSENVNAKHFYLFGREKNHSKNLLIKSELFSTMLAKS